MALPNLSTLESAMFENVTKTVDRFNQLSLANINVPRFTTFTDCYEFLNEYEIATATLTDEQVTGKSLSAWPIENLV